MAEILKVCWLEVHGKFEIAKLSPGVMYEVAFVVMMKDPAYGWEVPVNLKLALPDGNTQERKENLREKPKGQWIEIPVGQFRTTSENIGEIEFSLFEYEGRKWKRGLVEVSSFNQRTKFFFSFSFLESRIKRIRITQSKT